MFNKKYKETSKQKMNDNVRLARTVESYHTGNGEIIILKDCYWKYLVTIEKPKSCCLPFDMIVEEIKNELKP